MTWYLWNLVTYHADLHRLSPYAHTQRSMDYLFNRHFYLTTWIYQLEKIARALEDTT